MASPFPPPGGDFHIKVTVGDTRRLPLGCKLQILVSLRAVHKEIYKKCRDVSFNMASSRVQFKLDPHPHPGN